MKEEHEKTEGSLWVPFLVGGLVGAGLALLFAPKSGRELRKDIKDAATNTRDTVAASVEQGKEMYDQGLNAVTSAIEAGKAAFIEERDKRTRAA